MGVPKVSQRITYKTPEGKTVSTIVTNTNVQSSIEANEKYGYKVEKIESLGGSHKTKAVTYSYNASSGEPPKYGGKVIEQTTTQQADLSNQGKVDNQLARLLASQGGVPQQVIMPPLQPITSQDYFGGKWKEKLESRKIYLPSTTPGKSQADIIADEMLSDIKGSTVKSTGYDKYGYTPDGKPYTTFQGDMSDKLNIVNTNIQTSKDARDLVLQGTQEYQNTLDNISKIKNMSDDPNLRIYINADGIEEPYTKQEAIQYFRKHLTDVKSSIESNRQIAENYLTYVEQKKDIRKAQNTAINYEKAGYELVENDGKYSFKAPTPSEVVNATVKDSKAGTMDAFVTGGGLGFLFGDPIKKEKLYIAQSLRSSGIGTLLAGSQDVSITVKDTIGSVWDWATGKKSKPKLKISTSSVEYEKEKLASGILAGTRGSGESEIDFTKRYWSSPEVIVDVYIPLATLGASKLITIGGKAVVGTTWGAKIVSGGGKLATAGKVLGNPIIQGEIIGGLYVVTEGPRMIEIAKNQPEAFGSEFGRSAYHYGMMVGAGYVGSQPTQFTDDAAQRLLGGWNKTKMFVGQNIPATRTIVGRINVMQETGSMRNQLFFQRAGQKVGEFTQPFKTAMSNTKSNIQMFGRDVKTTMNERLPYYKSFKEQVMDFKTMGSVPGMPRGTVNTIQTTFDDPIYGTDIRQYISYTKSSKPFEYGPLHGPRTKPPDFTKWTQTKDDLARIESINKKAADKLMNWKPNSKGTLNEFSIIDGKIVKVSGNTGYRIDIDKIVPIGQKNTQITFKDKFNIIDGKIVKETMNTSQTYLNIGDLSTSNKIKLTTTKSGKPTTLRMEGDEFISSKSTKFDFTKKDTIKAIDKELGGSSGTVSIVKTKPSSTKFDFTKKDTIKAIDKELGGSSGTVSTVKTKPSTKNILKSFVDTDYMYSGGAELSKAGSVYLGPVIYKTTRKIDTDNIEYVKVVKPTSVDKTIVSPNIKITSLGKTGSELKIDKTDLTDVIKDTGIGTVSGIKLGGLTLIKQDSKLGLTQEQDLGINLKQNQMQGQLLGQKQAQLLDTIQIREPRPDEIQRPPPEEPRPIIPIKPILFGDSKLERKKTKPMISENKGYNVYVKERSMYHGKILKGTKFKKINDEPLSMENALALGGQVADETAAISFKIKPTKEKPTSGKTIKPWESIKHKFRKKGEVYIEKTPYRIDTLGEQKGITDLGIKTNIMKGNMNLLGKKRTKFINKNKRGKNVRYF